MCNEEVCSVRRELTLKEEEAKFLQKAHEIFIQEDETVENPEHQIIRDGVRVLKRAREEYSKVRRGKWITKRCYKRVYAIKLGKHTQTYCSCCGVENKVETPHCPNCGAEMNLKEEK